MGAGVPLKVTCTPSEEVVGRFRQIFRGRVADSVRKYAGDGAGRDGARIGEGARWLTTEDRPATGMVTMLELLCPPMVITIGTVPWMPVAGSVKLTW